MRIEPTVGRIVWYHKASNDGAIHQMDQPLAAQVAYVHADGLVNLSVLDAYGDHFFRLRVPLAQEDDVIHRGGHYCEWMPYQVGQAKKHESEEK